MLTVFLILAVIVLIYLVLRARAPLDIFKQFSLPAAQWTLVASDLGKGNPRKRLCAFGVVGEPDAIFKGNRTGQILVGEFKNRNYKGYVRFREYYQVILYLGLAREVFGESNVIGVLSFRNECLEVPFDEPLFRALIAIRGEVTTSLAKRKAYNAKPLHKRMKVVPRNRKIRLLG